MKKITGVLKQIFYHSASQRAGQRQLVIIFLAFGLILSLFEAAVPINPSDRLMVYGFTGLILVALVLAFLNILTPGRFIAPLAGFALITHFIFTGGIHDEAIGGYFFILMVAGLLFGDRGIVFFGILSTILILGIGFAEYYGWISTYFAGVTDPSMVITSAMFMLGTTLAAHYLVLRITQETRNAHTSEQAQLAANEDLRELQAELEERVNQRTFELQTANTKMTEQLEQIHSLQGKLQEEAVRDPLTGLFNRRYLEETLTRELARARRDDYPISFMLLDIDHFKQFNDLYGHDTGDAVLKALAEQLTGRSRAADIPCRIGGEEFLLVLPGILDEVAQLRAEYFRDQIQTMPIPFRGENLFLTVSIGIASFPKHGATWDELYHVVDQALYLAKERGRNRVECA